MLLLRFKPGFFPRVDVLLTDSHWISPVKKLQKMENLKLPTPAEEFMSMTPGLRNTEELFLRKYNFLNL